MSRDPAEQRELVTDTELESTDWTQSAEVRVPGLTVLYHPDLRRVGERALLPGLATGETQHLSRLEPSFHPLGDAARYPLAASRLSRRPLVLSAGDEHGSIRLHTADSPTTMIVDGTPIDDACELTASAIERGVVLLLGGSVVLLLHRLDPLLAPSPNSFGLIGESPAMMAVHSAIEQVADLPVPVLLRGETGTGKELVARAIHQAGPRQGQPYVPVNMAAIPASLAAAELFGSTRGAFTGADRQRRGYFRRAERGTLFLDEVGETPMEVQALLLRSLESREIQPVGGEPSTLTDVRVISATDLDLEAAIADGRFRAPLLHRLSGLVIRLPTLRERRQDFGRLLIHVLRQELRSVGAEHRLATRRQPWLPAPLVARMAAFDWPGNVRQLINVIRQLVILNRNADPASVPVLLETLLGPPGRPPTPRPLPLPPTPDAVPTAEVAAPQAPQARKPADIREEELIAALRANRWRPRAAADTLGIPRSSVYDLIAKSPRVRQGSQLSREEIETCHARYAGSIEAMADALEVSATALRRRMGQLGLKGG